MPVRRMGADYRFPIRRVPTDKSLVLSSGYARGNGQSPPFSRHLRSPRRPQGEQPIMSTAAPAPAPACRPRRTGVDQQF
jgi:hypothetical protein